MTDPRRNGSNSDIAQRSEDACVGRTVLGSFRLVGRLGEGSFATAYLAEQLGTERRAVVKIARPELIRGEHGAVYRSFFDAEARAATKVSHPNLVTIYTTGLVDDELPALAMEYVEGKPLGDVLHEHAPLPDAVVEGVFGQLAGALEALHADGVIHRDVSPDNIFVGARRRGGGVHVTLLDFGISQREGGRALVGGAAGTAPYIAPEQFQGQVTSATDMFSVGVLLWWAVTGQPWLDWMSTDEQIAHLSEMAVAPDPRGVRADISGALAVLVRSLLDPDPVLRPTAAQLLERLPAALHPGGGAVESPPLPAEALFPPLAAAETGELATGPTVLAAEGAPAPGRAARASTAPGARSRSPGALPGPTPPGSSRRRHTSRNRVAVATEPSEPRAEPAWKKLRDSRPVGLRAHSEPPVRSALRPDAKALGGPRPEAVSGTSPGGTAPTPNITPTLPMGGGRRRSTSQLPMGGRVQQPDVGATRVRQDSQTFDGSQPTTNPGLGTRLRQDSASLPMGGGRRPSTSQLPMGGRTSQPVAGGTRVRQDSQRFDGPQPTTSPGLGTRLRQDSASLPMGGGRRRSTSQLPMGSGSSQADGGTTRLHDDSESFARPQPTNRPGAGAPGSGGTRTSSAHALPRERAHPRRPPVTVRVSPRARAALSPAAIRQVVAALEDLQNGCDQARAAAVVADSADVLASFGPPDVNLPALHGAALHASVGGEALARGLTGVSDSQTVVRAAEGQVVLTPMPNGAALVLLISAQAKVGLALLAAKRAADLSGAALTP